VTTDILNPVDVEQRIRDIANRIANSVAICSDRYGLFLKADLAYDQAYAKAYLFHEGPQTEKRYAAELDTAKEREARDLADVTYRHADRLAKALEAELRAFQSVGASIRSMYAVAGRGE
jgi:hypothetical protein